MNSVQTLAEKIIEFYKNLDFTGKLPAGISVMNPYKNNPSVMQVVMEFFMKYYSDNNPRHMILGINPGRFGAGVTGITFTDTIRLRTKCGIETEIPETRELSSEFIYKVIDRYGGAPEFYSKFFVSAVCPLGFVLKEGKRGREINFNYYDNRELYNSVYDFIVENIEKQLSFGMKRDLCFCLGRGENFRFLLKMNEKYSYFREIVPLEHPRFIMQYRRKKADLYVDRYIEAFSFV